MTTIAPPATRPAARGVLRGVAVPSEHGGWGLTLEPALLGLLVAPSAAGALLAVAALLAFLLRTPLKIALVDRRRQRQLDRTVTARRVAAAEAALLAGALGAAAVLAAEPFWVPLAIAAPMAGTQLWYDGRSRSRRLAPELLGTVGIGSIVAAIALADGESAALAAGLWLVVAARALAAVVFVRLQLRRSKAQPHRVVESDSAQVAAIAVAAVGVALDGQLVGGLVAIVLLAAFHAIAARRNPPVAKVVGVQQTVAGLLVVGVTSGTVLGG